MVQYGGYGMSFGRQYYHAKKRSDETPLEHLYRLNVAAIRAKIRIREGSPSVRREHVKKNTDCRKKIKITLNGYWYNISMLG